MSWGGLGSSFPSHTKALCKRQRAYCLFSLCWRQQRGPSLQYVSNKKLNDVGPRWTRSNYPYGARHFNNLKTRIALRIKLDLVFNNQIPLDWIFAKIQVFKNNLSPIWTQFPCHSYVFGRFCKHECNFPFVITVHIYVNIVSTFF